LRMRSPALLRHINALKPADFKTITLDRPGPHNKPKVHEDKAIKLTSYPGTVRQFVVTGLGRDAATVIITNEHHAGLKKLISQYARRMTIEQRLAEIIRSFCADALSSTVNLNVDLDIMLCVLVHPLEPWRLRSCNLGSLDLCRKWRSMCRADRRGRPLACPHLLPQGPPRSPGSRAGRPAGRIATRQRP
jgi:hypothetical protein